jgi:hypothetical protein
MIMAARDRFAVSVRGLTFGEGSRRAMVVQNATKNARVQWLAGRTRAFNRNQQRNVIMLRSWQQDLQDHSLADQLRDERNEKLAALRAKPVFRDNETLADFTLAALSRMGYYVTDEILVAVQRIDASEEEKANIADGIELHALVSRKITAAYGKYLGVFADSRIGMAVVALFNLRQQLPRDLAQAGD